MSATATDGHRATAPSQLTPALLGDLARAAVVAQTWRSIVRFTAEQRWYRRLALTDDYEIWLLSWLPGQSTGFHDHGEASGAFAVARGELRESVGAPGRRPVRQRTAAAGSLTCFGGLHLHNVANVTAQPAVSVHAYSPPLSAMRRYEMTATGLALTGIDRADVQW
jgi:predicted metal-dependent enzyme (double-stranded beta helix superfamily)